MFDDVWVLDLATEPAWTELSPVGPAPVGRRGHVAIHDRALDRMVVYGGFSSNVFLDDAWALTLGEPMSWERVETTDDAPNRFSPGAVYDEQRSRMIVTGGWGGPNSGNSVWELGLTNTPEWKQLQGGYRGPSAREGHTLVFDDVQSRVLLFGGFWEDYPYETWRYNDTWALSREGSDRWVGIPAMGPYPSGRSAHASVFDPVGNRMIVFGGDDGTYRNDTWELSFGDGPAWRQLLPTGPMSSRRGHSAIFDPVRGQVVVFGGFDGTRLNDVWTLSLAEMMWTELMPSGTKPAGRQAHGAAYDPAGDRMLIFGGSGPEYFNDVWALALGEEPAWTQITPAGEAPTPRRAHQVAYNAAQRSLLVFGGIDATGYIGDFHALGLKGTPAWKELLLPITPARRGFGAAVHDPSGGGFVMFGGVSLTVPYFSDTWSFAGNAVWGPEVGTIEETEAQSVVPAGSIITARASVFPNPVQGRATVSFTLAQDGHVRGALHDVTGRLVSVLVDSPLTAGTHTVQWNGFDSSGRDVAPGTYFLRLTSDNGAAVTERITIVR
jgi:hypothetical protein